MTAQWPDLVDFDQTVFDLAGVCGGPLFEPADVGLLPLMINTACWRGHVCTYAVRGDRLILADLMVGEQCLLNGEKVTARTELRGVTPQRSERWGDGTLTFRGLDIPVMFSGGLLLGSGFIQAHYVHMGFHPAWKYRRVTEILLREGHLTEAQDRSAEIARIRRAIERGEVRDPDGVPEGVAWVRRASTLDYGRTFGPG
jgi:hypothetical protein